MRAHLGNYLAVFAGGALGGGLRLALTEIVAGEDAQAGWLLLISVLGSLALGVSTAIFSSAAKRRWHLFFGVGLCGSFTTYSAFATVVYEIGRVGVLLATGYALFTLVLATAAAGFGYWTCTRAQSQRHEGWREL